MGAVIAHSHRICSISPQMPVNFLQNEDEQLNGESLSLERNEDQMKRVRDSMLDMLIERTYDVNSYTRAQVLKSWTTLAEEGALPVVRVDAVAEVALDRLQDRIASVRKNAMSLLIALIDNNPFAQTLDGEQFRNQKKTLEASLAARKTELEKNFKQQMAESGLIIKSEDNDEVPNDELDGGTIDEDAPEQLEITEDNDIIAYRAGIKFCSAALRFISVVELALPKVDRLKSSKTVSDVIEALRLFSRASKFNVDKASDYLQKSFSLAWHQDESVKIECRLAFVNVYLSDGAVGSKPEPLVPTQIAHNIVTVCLACNTAELTSVEKIIGELFADENILSSSVINSLWQGVQQRFLLIIFCYLIH